MIEISDDARRFAALSPEAQAERFAALAAAALERFGISKDAQITLTSHRENAVFRVDEAATGARYALRIHRHGYQTEGSIRSELLWMEALREAGVETPEVIHGIDGDPVQTLSVPDVPEPRRCDVLRWVDGAPPERANLVETYRLLGEINARIHRQQAAWKRPPAFERQAWDEAGMLGADPLWGRFTDLEVLSDAQRDLLRRARDAVLARLDRFGKAADRYGLIHADLMAENILVDGGVPRVIDFDDCGFGWLLYDPATLLAFDTGEERFQDMLDAWVRGYRSVAPLSDDHLAELPTFIMCRFLVGLGWLHTRRETPMALENTAGIVELGCWYAERYLKEK